LVEVVLEGASSIGQSKTDVVDVTLVVEANKSVDFVTFGVQALLGHHHATLLRGNTHKVRQKGQVVGLVCTVLPNTHLRLTTTGRVENFMLLIKVEMTNTEALSERSTCNLLGKISAVPDCVFTFSLLVATRGHKEVFIDPSELACLRSIVSKCLYDAAFDSRVKVQKLTTLADGSEGLAIGAPSHAADKVWEIIIDHCRLLVLDIPNSHSEICGMCCKSIVSDMVPS
jgi:hypothetical protein